MLTGVEGISNLISLRPAAMPADVTERIAAPP